METIAVGALSSLCRCSSDEREHQKNGNGRKRTVSVISSDADKNQTVSVIEADQIVMVYGSKTSCTVVCGFVVHTLALVAIVIALVVPFWVVLPGGRTRGLLLVCPQDHDCIWFWENNFALLTGLPGNDSLVD